MTLKEENAILLESLSNLVDIVFWMTGSNDFAPEGQAYEGWKKAQPKVYAAKELVDGYVKKEDNYYEETANDPDAKDTDEIPSTDIIPGTDMMYRPYREPLIDNSAIEDHETAGQDSDGQTTVGKDSYPSTEVS